MNRRNFLSLISAGMAGIALEQAIPLGRVWSFPKKIIIASASDVDEYSDWVAMDTMRMLQNLLVVSEFEGEFNRELMVGEQIRIRTPQRYLVTEPSA